MRYRPLAERFWEKVDRRSDDECWEWQAFRTPKGYGLVHLGTGQSMAHAHRVAWALSTGVPPDGQVICHRCDNRACCNPGHLFIGSQEDNIADMVAKGRHRTGSRPGRRMDSSKLTQEAVDEIRRRLACGESQRSIAGDYGITQSTVSEIKSRKIWNT